MSGSSHHAWNKPNVQHAQQQRQHEEEEGGEEEERAAGTPVTAAP